MTALRRFAAEIRPLFAHGERVQAGGAQAAVVAGAQLSQRRGLDRHVVTPAAADLGAAAEVAPARLAGLLAEGHAGMIANRAAPPGASPALRGR
jgi:hypothetical protein